MSQRGHSKPAQLRPLLTAASLLALACASATPSPNGSAATPQPAKLNTEFSTESTAEMNTRDTNTGPENAACSVPDECHMQAMQLDRAGKIFEAQTLYVTNCERGYGASCYAVGDISSRCLYVSGYPFFDAAELYLHAACDARYSRGCFALYELNFPPTPANRPAWLPTQVQCNLTRAALTDRVPPGSSKKLTWLSAPPQVPMHGAAVSPVACGQLNCSDETNICCSTSEGTSCVKSPRDCPEGKLQAQLLCTDKNQCAAEQKCCAFLHSTWCAVECEMGGYACLSEAGCPKEILGDEVVRCSPDEDGLFSSCLTARDVH